ncbi:RHS repeat-associated core domain-containing protein, partial [Tahibacter soli]
HQRLCKTIEPESGATVQAYNSANLVEWKATGQSLTSTTNCQQASVASNQKIGYTYDARNRLLTTSYGDGSPNVVRTYTFDGLLETITSDNSRWTTTYNKRRLSTNETLQLDGVDYAIGYAHSRNGHVSGMTYPDGTAIDYAPNALGEATRVGSYATQIVTHPNGALAGFTYGNGIAHTTEQNERGLPSRSVDGSVLSDRYTYDANANVASITDENGGAFTRTMTYDDLDRLKTARNDPRWGGTQTFGYDALDNLRTTVAPGRTWTNRYDAQTLRLTSVDDGPSALIAYGYDARGRVTSRTVRGQPTQTFAIDLADRVRQVGPNVASYRYDGHGRRTMVTKNGVATVQIYSQAGQLLYQSAPTSTNDGIFKNGFQQGDTTYPPQTGGNKRYVYLGRHLIAEDGTAGRRYIHTDGLGSPALTTNTSGVATARNDYQPYGWGPAVTSTPGFTGHVADAETGLSYMQARYYDPFAGRFLAIDPVSAEAETFNRYWYANNNPYKNIDPDGRDAGMYYTEPRYAVPTPNLPPDVALLALEIEATIMAGPLAPRAVSLIKGLNREAINKGTSGGPRAGKPFTKAGKKEVIRRNEEKNNGVTKCEGCNRETSPAKQSKPGTPTPKDETRIDHIFPKKEGGDGAPSNGQVLCSECNLDKGPKIDWVPPKYR